MSKEQWEDVIPAIEDSIIWNSCYDVPKSEKEFWEQCAKVKAELRSLAKLAEKKIQ